MTNNKAKAIGRFVPPEGQAIELTSKQKSAWGRITIHEGIEELRLQTGEYIPLLDAVKNGLIQSYAPGSRKPLVGNMQDISLEEEIYRHDLDLFLAVAFPKLKLSHPNPEGVRKMWTPEKLAELADYRANHTMPETAAKFKISEQRIRKLLPRKKPKASPFPV